MRRARAAAAPALLLLALGSACVASRCTILEKRSEVALLAGPGEATLVVRIVDEMGQPADAIPDLVSKGREKTYLAPRLQAEGHSYEFRGLAPNGDYTLGLYARCKRAVPGEVRTLDHVRLDHRVNLRPNETREIVITLNCRAARALR